MGTGEIENAYETQKRADKAKMDLKVETCLCIAQHYLAWITNSLRQLLISSLRISNLDTNI